MNVVNVVNMIHMMGTSCRLDRIGCLGVHFAFAIFEPTHEVLYFQWIERRQRRLNERGGGYDLGPESWKTRIDYGPILPDLRLLKAAA